MKLYHGSPFLFDSFSLNDAGEGTGLKFGYGVYLTNRKHRQCTTPNQEEWN